MYNDGVKLLIAFRKGILILLAVFAPLFLFSEQAATQESFQRSLLEQTSVELISRRFFFSKF